MLTRLRALAPRALPNGWPDVVRQVLIFAAAYYAYRLVRGAVDGRTTAAAFEHARDIIGLERSLHLFVEPSRAGVGRDASRGSSTSRAGCTSTRTCR